MKLVKILIECDLESLSGGSPEIVWAKQLLESNRNDLFEIHNSPFYAKGISYLDVVVAKRANIYGDMLCYESTFKKSKHSTYRILVDKHSSFFQELWDKLEALGCTYESSDQGENFLYSVDVPESTNIYAVYNILQDAEDADIWQFDEGHCGHDLNQADL